MRQLAAAALAFAYAGGAMAFAPAPSALPATRGVSLRAAGHSMAPQARPTVSLGRKGRAALRMAETMEGRHMPQIIQGGMGVQVCVPCVSQTDAADCECSIHKTSDCGCKCAVTQTCTGARALYSIPQHCLLPSQHCRYSCDQLVPYTWPLSIRPNSAPACRAKAWNPHQCV